MKGRIRSDDTRRVSINMDQIQTYAGRYKPGTWFDFEFKRKVRKPTTPQRKYYFAIVLPVFMEAYGYDPDEKELLHQHLKCTFFQVKPDKHGVYRKKDIPAVFADDSEKSVQEVQRFTDWVIRKSSEAGYYTPEPNE